MDFEYQNRTGPMDSRSGFARVGQTPHLFSQTAKKRESHGETDATMPYV